MEALDLSDLRELGDLSDLSEMSKAFTKEDDDVAPAEEPLPPRPRDPSPITARGLRALRDEHQALVDAGHAHERRARVVKSILDTVREKPSTDVGRDAGFGCAIVVEHEDGRQRTWEVVGPDETDPAHGRISLVSPLGRALLGRVVGDVVVVKKPGGDEELRVLSIAAVT